MLLFQFHQFKRHQSNLSEVPISELYGKPFTVTPLLLIILIMYLMSNAVFRMMESLSEYLV